MISARVVVFFFSFTFTLLAFAKSIENTDESKSRQCEYQKTDFGNFARVILGALNFFEIHSADLVLDAAVGTRILEGQLELLLNSNFRLPPKLRNFLEKLVYKSEMLTRNILNSVRNNPNIEEREKHNTIPWITSPGLWESPDLYDWRTIKFSETPAAVAEEQIDFRKAEPLNETVSDTCIAQLFANCQITERCARLFLKRPLLQYSLTHQVIYLIIGKQRGCFSRLIFKDKVGWKEFADDLCSQVWREANHIHKNNFPTELRDLFTEQVVVCSLLGYEQFLRRDWLANILTWRSGNSNCFLNFEMQNMEAAEKSPSLEFGSIRHKKSDTLLEVNNDEVCSAHFTAIGIAAVGIHMRKLLENCLI